MDWDEFSDWSKRIAEWGSQYHKTLRDRPVRAQTKPGEIAAQLPDTPPRSLRTWSKYYVILRTL